MMKKVIKMNQLEKVEHTLSPIYDVSSKILILGTMPSPKSREAGFYYSHPQNRFWKIMAALFNEELPINNQQKKEMMQKHHIALWDVLKSCEIKGADDNSITSIEVNAIDQLLQETSIQKIYTTGLKATTLYKKHCLESTGMESIYLPSTSPANCRNYNLDKLIDEYRCILKDL